MKRQMSHRPHPFHIVGECEECCDESEALRTGYDGPIRLGCNNYGCVNWPGYDEIMEEEADAADLEARIDAGWLA